MLTVTDINLEVISYLNDYDLIQICKLIKKYKSLCQNNVSIRNRINEYLKKQHHLMNMAEQYNSTHPGSIINLEKYNKIEELIILLWERQIDVKQYGFMNLMIIH